MDFPDFDLDFIQIGGRYRCVLQCTNITRKLNVRDSVQEPKTLPSRQKIRPSLNAESCCDVACLLVFVSFCSSFN